jgi:outer membrane protein assembly factor BamD
LGVNDEAQRSAAILGYNHPTSDWYTKAYELLTEKKLVASGQKDSWFTKIKTGISDLF